MPITTIDEQLLARFVPMSALGASHLRELSNHAVLLDFAPGDSLDEVLRMVESTYYLVEGELSITGGGGPDTLIKSSDANARFSLTSPETVGRRTRAKSTVHLLRLERAKISTLLIWAQASGEQATEQSSQAFRDDITTLLLKSRLFARIPPSNIERIGQLVEPVTVKSGEVVIRQGDIGDYYYIIKEGTCDVLREQADSSEPLRLAQLGNSASFGEEALLTDSERNATVRMSSDGVLLRLTRDYFIDLISAPLLHEVSHERAEDLLATGARWVDVRLPEEFERDGLDDAINLPLSELRSRMTELPKGGSYITVCNSGRRAQASAFLLSQHGFHACSLRDGIAKRRPRKRGIRAIEENLGTLQAELLRANAALEDALKEKALADATQDIEARTQQSSVTDAEASARLQQLTLKTAEAGESLRAAMEKKRLLESTIRETQARETSAQRDAQEQVERMRIQAQTRLEAEKQRLSDYYRDASSQLEQVEQKRREAQSRFEEERRRIERELELAREQMDAEAERIRQAMEQAQRDAEKKAVSIRIEHQQLEKNLRQQTEETLLKEREHLEEEFSRSIAAHERARQSMELVEAERMNAEQETARLRAATEEEIRQHHIREQLKRNENVQKLRAQSEDARKRLEQAQLARDEALARHQHFNATLTDTAHTNDPQREQELREEINIASAKLTDADTELDQAQRQHTRATKAEQVAKQTQAAAIDREDELRLQIYEEMQAWIEEEHSQTSDEVERAAEYARELERIHADKERKRLEALHANENMFSDIESLLSGQTSDDPLNIAMRTHTIAEEKARLVGKARLKISEDAARARAALKNPTK